MATHPLFAHETAGSPASTGEPAILITAFEPSGDAHAAPVIAELRRLAPATTIYAWGGPKMARAGAIVIETTGQNPAMGANALAKIGEHMAINRRLRAWLAESPQGRAIRVHVPVDSPAANFPICELTRRAGCGIVHLVAPQMWAWGSWRVRKLRRLTDHVLCLLPFEPAFFEPRGVRATYIGHPVLARAIARDTRSDANLGGLPHSRPRLALLPGSRPAEIDHVLPLMGRVLERVVARSPLRPSLVLPAASEALLPRIQQVLAPRAASSGKAGGMGAAVATGPGDAGQARLHIAGLPVEVVVDRFDDVLAWADVVLTCSGTATLDVTRAGVPMVVVYATDPLPWHLIGRWLLRAPLRALPNLVAGRRVIPEFIPHFGPVDPIADALVDLLASVDPASGNLRPGSPADHQVAAQAEIRARFAGATPAVTAARHILDRLASATSES